ncbi:MAG: hypothetical protein OXN27_05200 [Candidatus Poribacteria bacterium]|nr:hypothetical protein [Candidatus Poribacteria bacterium]
MRQVKWLLICLFILFAVSLVFKFGCTTEDFGKTGFNITLSVTGMTRVTSAFSVMSSLQKIDNLVIEDATYKVVKATLPFGKLRNEAQVSVKYTPSTNEVSFKKETDEPTKPVLENKIGWHLKPDEPKYFIVVVQALAGADPANGVSDIIADRVKAALIEAVEDLGFEARVESMEAREVTSMKRYTLGFN